MSTTNKRALEVKARMSDKFEGAFSKTKKRKKAKKGSGRVANQERVVPIAEMRSDDEIDISPPCDDNE